MVMTKNTVNLNDMVSNLYKICKIEQDIIYDNYDEIAKSRNEAISCYEEGCCSKFQFTNQGGCWHAKGGCWHDNDTTINKNVMVSDMEICGYLKFSSSVDTHYKEQTGIMCCVSKTHMYLKDYTNISSVIFTVPLRFLVVRVDKNNHSTFSLHLNIKSTFQIEPHFFLHAITNIIRNKWLAVFYKHNVSIELKNNNIYTKICPFNLADITKGFDNKNIWHRIIWI
tara:strand:- start:3086 stop:3760 length:675 start_codon:yes stop_codon:yes gene_type:complete